MLPKKLYENRYLDKKTDVFLSCLEEKGEIRKTTSKEIKSHIDLLKYGYTMSLTKTDRINEIILLFIGSLITVLIENFAILYLFRNLI
jgi:hypothetical protein